jgi:hypothetical protein
MASNLNNITNQQGFSSKKHNQFVSFLNPLLFSIQGNFSAQAPCAKSFTNKLKIKSPFCIDSLDFVKDNPSQTDNFIGM